MNVQGGWMDDEWAGWWIDGWMPLYGWMDGWVRVWTDGGKEGWID